MFFIQMNDLSISRGELIHYKIQAAMREYNFPSNELMYLGEREGDHWYLIAGEYEVPAHMIEGFDKEEEG